MCKYLNQNFGGVELRDSINLTRGLESIRDEINTALKVLNNFIYPDAADFVVTGQKKLVDSSDFYSIDKVKNLVELFDKKQTLKDLMLKCIENENIRFILVTSRNRFTSRLQSNLSTIPKK